MTDVNLTHVKTMLNSALQRLLGDRFYDLYFWYFFLRKTPKPTGKKKNILVVNHVFEQDIEALEKANTTFNFITISAFVLRNVGTLFFPPEVESYTFFNSPSLDPIKKRYEKVIDRFIDRLIKKYTLSGIISPSDNFFYIRQLVLSAQKRQIPFIVVDKEGTICPAYFTHFARYIREKCPLLADSILVWSDRQKLFWEKTGVPKDRIYVTGQPRSDFWHQQDRWLSKEQLGIPGLRSTSKILLFFTYDPWAYTPDYMIEKGEMNWSRLRQETTRVIYAFAKKHPEIDVIIKAHPQQLDLKELQEDIDAQHTTSVHLVTGSTLSNQLIINADCIVGFQSTALIEAMLTKKPILYTFWGEARDKWSKDLIPFHETAGVTVTASPDQLAESLEKAFLIHELPKDVEVARKVFVDEYFFSVDGQASRRTLDVLERLINMRRV